VKSLQHIAELGSLFYRLGIRHVVICPGSRNAPLIQLFTGSGIFQCHSIVDERSAAYVALGMAREQGRPVVVLTTSGTAVLNLAPAVAEAYYQRIPLVVVTADRPLELLPPFNNQWIDQEAPYFSYSRGFYQVPLTVKHEEDLERMLAQVERLVASAREVPPGPVHLNVPLDEPLYEELPPALSGSATSVPGREVAAEDAGDPGKESGDPSPEPLFPEDLPAGHRILVLAGMGLPDARLKESLEVLLRSRQAAVIAENIANLPGEGFISCPELLLAWAGESGKQALVPDLILSLGGQVVSKRLKNFLQSGKVPAHIELGPGAAAVIGLLAQQPSPDPAFRNAYLDAWLEVAGKAAEQARRKLERLPFGNLSAMECIMRMIPAGAAVHLGNSATIRYSQLVPFRPDLRYYSNRGTSGIDGCLSTAAGASMVSEDLHILVLGDLSFVYDSNSLWNRNFPENLKVIVLNDGGGGIFRLLNGPDRMDFFEEYQVTAHPVSIELLAQAFGREMKRVESGEDLKEHLLSLFEAGNRTSVLEVDTSRSENSRIFKDFLDQKQ
jgi:2-succinyl-5-enolpyruvyl-6-hydroxy-3-cyclohexene-1-carboxylate synthase